MQPDDQLTTKKRLIDWQVAASIATVLAFVVIIVQTWLLNEQFLLQKETADRAWAAELLLTIYTESSPAHVRAEAVKAYLLLQRELDPEDEVNLNDVNLVDMDLTGIDFTKVSLKHANLIGTNLTDATLNDADFEGGDLRGVNMTRAKLHGANLSKTQLAGAILISAKLINAKLNGAKFREEERSAGNPDQAGPNISADLATGFLFQDREPEKKEKRSFGAANATDADLEGAVFDKDTSVCGLNASGAKLAEAKGMTEDHCKEGCLITSSGTTLPPH